MLSSVEDISNVFDGLRSLGVYQMHGWPIKIWEQVFIKQFPKEVIEQWIVFAKPIVVKKREWTFEYNRVEIQKELESFPRRLELCLMIYIEHKN